MGKKINVYFNICVLPHKKQFERVPCSFDGFPYLNSFHTSALGVLWGLQSEGANSPSQAKHVVSKSCAKQMLMTTLMSRLPSAAASPGSRLCRLWQAWPNNFSVLQINSLGIEASAESASTEQKSLLFWYGFVSIGGRRVLTSLPPPPLSQPAVVPVLLQQLFVSALVNGDFSIVSFLPDTWAEGLPRDQRGQWRVFYYLWSRKRSAAHPKSTWDKPPKAEKSKIARTLSSAWMESFRVVAWELRIIEKTC